MPALRRTLTLAAFAGLSAGLVSAAHAADPPLITKLNQSGFTTAEGQRQETCAVYDDHVVIERRFGGGGPGSFTQRERRAISLSRGVRGAIRRALEEEVAETENSLCDAPTTTTAIGALDSGNVLFESGGCGSPRRERLGPHSDALRSVIDSYCPVTHDFTPLPEPLPEPVPEPGGE